MSACICIGLYEVVVLKATVANRLLRLVSLV